MRRRAYMANRTRAGRSNKHLLPFVRLFLFILICASLIGGIAGTVYGVKQWIKCCPYFYVSNIEIEGIKRLSKAEVLRLAGFHKGDNIFALDLEAIKDRLLENPWIRNVRIDRRFPDTIAMQIVERLPLGLVRLGEKLYLVDEYGTAFKLFDPKDSFSAPVITGVAIRRPDNGKGPSAFEVKRDRMADAIRILKMSRRGVRALGFNNISQIDFPNDDTVVIYTADKAVPFHISRKDLKRQFYRAEKILVQLYNSGQYQKVSSVNVGYGKDMALARLKGR